MSIIWATLPVWLGFSAYVLLWRSWNLSLAIITPVLWDPRNMLYTHEYTHGFYTWFFSICIHISIVVLINHNICLIAIFLVSEAMDAIQVVWSPLLPGPRQVWHLQETRHTRPRCKCLRMLLLSGKVKTVHVDALLAGKMKHKSVSVSMVIEQLGSYSNIVDKDSTKLLPPSAMHLEEPLIF